MSEIKRYHLEIGVDPNGYDEAIAVEHAEGYYCKADETLAIAAELATATAKIARLKAQLAETWQPVSDGTYPCACEGGCDASFTYETDEDYGAILRVKKPTNGEWINLGEYRLCRKVASTVAVE